MSGSGPDRVTATPAIVTAGHCGAPSESVFHVGTSQRIGHVGTRYLNSNEYVDFEYIRITSGSVDNSVWVGGPGTSDLRSVVAANNDDSLTGVQVCSSGAIGGLVCGVLTRHDGIIDDGVRTIGLACVNPNNAAVHTEHGDSGGPWLTTFGNGTVMAWGQHVGREDCDQTQPGGDADDEMMFSKVKNISARVGASLIVS